MGLLDPPPYSRPEIDRRLKVTASPALLAADPEATGEVRFELDGDGGIFSTAASSWIDEAGPQARLRVSRAEPDNNGATHLLITPYRFGAAIEYPGVVECWVGEWSIHNNVSMPGPPRPARLWVGNNDDTGGLYLSAVKAGNKKRAEIISQLFDATSSGFMRLVVREDTDYFTFEVGAENVEVERARIDKDGIKTDSLGGLTGSEVTIDGQLRWADATTTVGPNDGNEADALPPAPAAYLEVRGPDGEALLIPAYRAVP